MKLFDIISPRKSVNWLYSVAQKQAEALLSKPKAIVIKHFDDGALMEIRRKGKIEQSLRLGPNSVHAFITHVDGSITDLGESFNLLTNIGRDVFHSWIGGFNPAGNTVASNISTAVGATSITGTGSVWTASNLGTPQLGCASLRVYAAPHTTTNPVVYGNIISNTTNVLTIDKWWKNDDTTGTTPTNTDAFILGSGGLASVRFMALTNDAGAASASDTVLASEITTNGLGRALATYAHTQGAATQTLSHVFNATGNQSCQKMGLFCALSSAGADPMVFETAFSAASLINLDQITVTDTITVSG
jgi:hypothetical protein